MGTILSLQSFMTSTPSPILAAAGQRPAKLYRYSHRTWLERSLSLGEFRLRAPLQGLTMPQSGRHILPFAEKQDMSAGYLTLSLAHAWDEALFALFSDADACLVIHDTEEFGERIHRAAQKTLPSWAGIDAAMSYGVPSPLGSAFSKSRQSAQEKEWLFAWRPTQSVPIFNPVTIRIGSIESIAEIRLRSA
jgi:hypothetical protein